MASSSSSSTGSVKLSYERLKQDDDFGLGEKVIGRYLRGSSHHRFFRKVHVRRRLKVKIPSSRRFLSRKARVLMAAWLKMYRRLKDSRAHFGDIFAGNYLFMQVTPIQPR
ncbi:uncharacterized protein LOC142538316 [Primulina tabacum]|uniref:uncharacterized protein LOC142538316 n=1 Tax=Primulina tabacum TaxID=48773 RepID=UPI003F5AC227